MRWLFGNSATPAVEKQKTPEPVALLFEGKNNRKTGLQLNGKRKDSVETHESAMKLFHQQAASSFGVSRGREALDAKKAEIVKRQEKADQKRAAAVKKATEEKAADDAKKVTLEAAIKATGPTIFAKNVARVLAEDRARVRAELTEAHAEEARKFSPMPR